MKRDFLAGLGLEQEVIDKIMAENGKDIGSLKTDLEVQRGVVEDLKGKLGVATTSLSKFDGVDLDKLRLERDTAVANYKQALKDKDIAVESVKKDSALDSYLSNYKFSSDFAKNGIKSIIAEKNLKFSDNKFDGIDDLMKTLVDEHKDAFIQESDVKNPSFTAPMTGGAGTAGASTSNISYLTQSVKDSPWLQ